MTLIFALSLIGFLSSLGIHIATFVPSVELTMVTGFCLFFPALLVGAVLNVLIIARRRVEYITLPKGEFWKFVTQRAPDWMRAIQVILLIYIVFNYVYILVLTNRGGFPRQIGSQFFLMSYKDILRELTWEEYLYHVSLGWRLLSSIVMAVYFSALTRWLAGWFQTSERENVLAGESSA
jgi:hypothetical protein